MNEKQRLPHLLSGAGKTFGEKAEIYAYAWLIASGARGNIVMILPDRASAVSAGILTAVRIKRKQASPLPQIYGYYIT